MKLRKFEPFFILFFTLNLTVVSCGDSNQEGSGPNEVDIIAIEMQKIQNVYLDFTTKMIAQDYEGALSLTVPGSNGEGMINVAKKQWDDGWQYYFDFGPVEAWLTEEWLEKNYAEAVGNVEFVQHRLSQYSKYELGFYSSIRKIDDNWKIDGVNTNLEVDWW